MAICETCGTRYTRTAQTPECPACATAKKPRPKAAPAAGAPRPTTASKPAQATAARASAANPPLRQARPATSATPRPKARAPEPPPPPEHHQVAYVPPQGAMDKATKVGFMITLGLGLIVAIVVFQVMGTKAEERKVRQEHESAVKAIFEDLKALNVEKPTDAEQIIKKAGESESVWQNHDLAGDIQRMVVHAKTNLDSYKEQQGVVDSFTSIEKELASPEGLLPERVKDLRRQLDELEVRVTQAGPELLARYSIARGTADKTYATRLIDDAKAFEQANGDNPRLSLLRYQTAEDEIKVLLDRSYHEKITELQEFYTPLYKQVILESDRLAGETFTAAATDKLPWIDCLTGEQAGLWNPSDAKGFSHRVENHQLQIQGPDPDAGKLAVMSIGDREQWRNFAWDFEFVIEKGNFDVYFRLGRVPNMNTHSYSMETDGEDKNLVAGKTYRGRATFLGSTFDVRYADEDIDTPTPKTEAVLWTMSRKGAIGLVIPASTSVRFTRFAVRELR